MIHRMELVEYRHPDVVFRATVSPGTYLRAIARDLGERLGLGAHLDRAPARGDRRRLRVDDAVPIDGLGPDSVRPVRTVLGHLPVRELDEAARIAMSHGRAVPADDATEGDVALVRGDELVAVARAGGRVAPAVRRPGDAVSGLPPLPRGSTVTVGSFDGMHLGHQAVLREIADRARAAGGPASS